MDQKCTNHEFIPMGFHVLKVENTTVEAIAAVVCKFCSMFRTKILTFRREIVNQ